MKRYSLSLAVCVVIGTSSLYAQTADDPAKTSAWLAALQNPDGGFGPKAGAPSTLPSTSSAVRTLKNTRGSIPDVLGCVKYVESCRDAESGGFAPTPGGKPDIRTTAVGLMVAAELKFPIASLAPGAVAFFSKNVKDFEEIRIAVAGLEAIKTPSPDFPAWTAKVEAGRNAQGSFGEGLGIPRATGSATAALLRMGVKLDKRDAVLAAMRAGQRPDGGWSKDDGPSDLETSYRIMRSFYMLKEKPDLAKVRTFLARYANADGGYGLLPGAPSDLGGIYFVTTIARWVRLLDGEPPFVETVGFVPLFNGTDLTGWEGDTKLWAPRDGMIVGTSEGLKHNDFLATEKSYGDFILKLTFRLLGTESSNTGVQFRSVRIPNHEMFGYQADIGQNYWGCLYDESRRKTTLVKASQKALDTVKTSGWNTYEIRAMGSHVQMWLNGVLSVDYTETDPQIARTGRIALQIHAGDPMVVQFKDILIQPLPTPAEGASTTPGFHLRKLDSEQGERFYSVFLPEGYDGKKKFPVVMFLHGSGERGKDGVSAAQIGLGSAILAHPSEFPFVAVFPQARENWSPYSDDTRAALEALDEVLATYKTSADRVILTGLSMGGAGTWALASAHPQRFIALAPICGVGKRDFAYALKGLSVWGFVGDQDRERSVLNLRAMTERLRGLGTDVRETEYLGVGHVSWDRAYNDPSLIHWMRAQASR